MRRWSAVAAPGMLVLAEVYLAIEYLRLHASWHYWLHGLIGVGLGVAVMVIASALRRSRPSTAVVCGAAALGHVFAAFPDVLFLQAGVLHASWMDVFAAHIGVHFLPAPLAVSFAIFAGGLLGVPLLHGGRRTAAVAIAVATIASLIALLPVAGGPPETLEELRTDRQLACVLRAVDPPPDGQPTAARPTPELTDQITSARGPR
jgi:hypothetical protein